MVLERARHLLQFEPRSEGQGARPSWNDLCNPFFKGSVSFDPAEDRYLAGLYAMLGEEETEKLLKCIGDNDPIIQRGHTQRIELMLAGDHMLQGDNYLYHGIAMQRKNPKAPYAIVYSAPAVGFAGVATINKNTQHPYAAALWTDWTLTEESQKYVATLIARADRAQASDPAREHEDHHLQRRAGRCDEAAARRLEQIRGQAALSAVRHAR